MFSIVSRRQTWAVNCIFSCICIVFIVLNFLLHHILYSNLYCIFYRIEETDVGSQFCTRPCNPWLFSSLELKRFELKLLVYLVVQLYFVFQEFLQFFVIACTLWLVSPFNCFVIFILCVSCIFWYFLYHLSLLYVALHKSRQKVP